MNPNNEKKEKEMKNVTVLFVVIFCGCIVQPPMDPYGDCPGALPDIIRIDSCVVELSAAWVKNASSGFLTGEVLPGEWDDAVPIFDEDGDGYFEFNFPTGIEDGYYNILYVGDREGSASFADGFWPYFRNREIIARMSVEAREFIYCDDGGDIPGCALRVEFHNNGGECILTPAGNMGGVLSATHIEEDGRVCYDLLPDPIKADNEECSLSFNGYTPLGSLSLSEVGEDIICDEEDEDGYYSFSLSENGEFYPLLTTSQSGCGERALGNFDFIHIIYSELFYIYLSQRARSFIDCEWIDETPDATPIPYCHYRVRVRNANGGGCSITPLGNMDFNRI